MPDESDRLLIKRQEEHLDQYQDDADGGSLDAEMVRKARKEELGWIL